MKVIKEDSESTVIELSNVEKELIDCMFSMINSEDYPNWGATDIGYGGPRLDEKKFDVLCDAWRGMVMNNRIVDSISTGNSQKKVAI